MEISFLQQCIPKFRAFSVAAFGFEPFPVPAILNHIMDANRFQRIAKALADPRRSTNSHVGESSSGFRLRKPTFPTISRN